MLLQRCVVSLQRRVKPKAAAEAFISAALESLESPFEESEDFLRRRLSFLALLFRFFLSLPPRPMTPRRHRCTKETLRYRAPAQNLQHRRVSMKASF